MKAKKFLGRLVLILGIVLVLSAMVVVAPAMAQTVAPPVTAGAPFDISLLLAELVGLAGVAGLISLGINVAKSAGWVQDGQAPTISAVANFILLGILMAARIFKPDMDIGQIDAQIASFVNVGTVVFAYVIQLLASKATHAAVAGVPVIGKSFTLERTAAWQAEHDAAVANLPQV